MHGTAEPGDILCTHRGTGCSKGVLHSFSSAVPGRMVLLGGYVHVAVGFQDLGALSCNELCGEDQGVLHWVGYSCSEYSVAKAKVRTPPTHSLCMWYRV